MALVQQYGASTSSSLLQGQLAHPLSGKRFARPFRSTYHCKHSRTTSKGYHRNRNFLVTRASDRQATTLQPYGPGTLRDIPIFPLSVVAFPTGDVPLNIFEARYRVLFSTLLAGADGIEEELINYQKPWRGSRLFGMCYVTNEGAMTSIGTTLHIVQHQRLPDGRISIMGKGIEKFQIMKVLEERPVLICQVKMLEDSNDQSQPVQELAQHDIQLFKDLIALNVKMNRLVTSEVGLTTKFEAMSPREISYWLALVFSQSPVIQQALLEEKSLERRLIHEREILEASTKFLRAKVALQSAFTPESPETPISAEGIAQAEGVAEASISDGPQDEQKTSAEGSIASEDSSNPQQSPEGSKSADQGSDRPEQDSADSS